MPHYLVTFTYTPNPDWHPSSTDRDGLAAHAFYQVQASSPLGAIRKAGGRLRHGYTRWVAGHVVSITVKETKA